MSKFSRRLVISMFFPLLSFYFYWTQIDGDYTGNQLLWALVITLMAILVIFLYFPVAKKIERGSMAWSLGLISVMFLVSVGIVGLIGSIAWGLAVGVFACWIPVIHEIAYNWDKTYKWSLFKRSTLVEDERAGER